MSLEVLEELTSNVKQIQDNVLEEILQLNANTEYLHRFLHGSSVKELFKKNVPVVSHDDIKPYIDRVANGEPFDVITSKPITRFIQSSGTSRGKFKIFPVNNDYFEKMNFVGALWSSLTSKYIDGTKQCKEMRFLMARPEFKTPCGFQVAPAITSILIYQRSKLRSLYTSPEEVIFCLDSNQSIYCQLLCGLVQRDEVMIIAASFASTLVRAIDFLENNWKELCSNIRSCHVSDWITDLSSRNSVSSILGDPNPELADLIEQECSCKSWEGIISRLWSKTKAIKCVVTGQMTQYIPTLEFYSGNLPLLSLSYSSSESIFGINLNPLCKPQDVSYTFLPNMSYFEFLPVDDENTDEIVDLANVKLGCCYDILVTSHFGLYRYRMGDILQVIGFYNNAPQFKFIRRKSVVLNVEFEATTEEDILKGLSQVTTVLEFSGLMLKDVTSYVDISTLPGHYVFYWELKSKKIDDIVEIRDDKVMVECCSVMEESFDVLYKEYRSKDGAIGPLEIRVVQQGTFDSLMEYFISKGSSQVQYKTPLCIKSPEALKVLEDKVDEI